VLKIINLTQLYKNIVIKYIHLFFNIILTYFAGKISVTRVHETGVIPTDEIKMVVRKSTSTIHEVIGSAFFQ